MLKKLVIIFSIIILISLITFYLYPKIAILYFTKKLYPQSKEPWAYSVPVDRSITIKNTNLTNEILYDSMTFKVPWETIKEKKQVDERLILSFHHNNENKGISIVNYKFPKIDIREIVINTGLTEKNILETEIGEDLSISGYDVYNQILSSSPDRWNIFSSNEKLSKNLIYVMLKRAFTRHSVMIYRFNNGKIRGFQFGEPATEKGLEIIFFNSKNRAYKLYIFGATEKEINQILSSFN